MIRLFRYAVFFFFSLLSFTAFAQNAANTSVWLAPACKPKLFGLQDANGSVVVSPRYDFLSEQENNRWIALSGGKCGVINEKGEWIIRPEFLSIEQFRNGLAVAAKRKPRRIPNNNYDDPFYTRDSVVYYGVLDESGTWVIDPLYDFLELGDDGTVLYSDENGLYGYLNPDGSVLIRARFVYATPMSGGAAIVGENRKDNYRMNGSYYGRNRYNFYSGNYFVIDHTGKKLNEQPYDLIRSFSEGRAAFNKGGLWKSKRYGGEQKMVGGKWGFLDASGNPVVNAEYDYVYDFENGVAKVRLGDQTYWIDKNGNKTAPPVAAEESKLKIFCEPGSFGYLNLKGEWMIQPQFYAAHEFSEGLAAAMTLRASDMDCDEPEMSDGLYSGRNAFDVAHLWNAGTRRRNRNEETVEDLHKPLRRLFGYIDLSGNMVIPAKYEFAMPFHENRAYVCFRGKWGVIDRQGNWIMAPVLDWLDQMSYLNSSYYDYNRYDYFSNSDYDFSRRREGLKRITDQAPSTDLYFFSEGMGAVSYEGKFGFIDTAGKIVVAPVYDKIMPFSQGLAAVRHNDKWGYIDKTGKEIIPFHFREAGSFSDNGLAVVGTSMKESGLKSPEEDLEYEEYGETFYGYIDRSGKWAIKPQFSSAGDFSEGLAVASVNYNMKGYIDKTGKFVIPAKYDNADSFHNGFAFVHIRTFEYVYIDKSGKISKIYSKDHPPAEKERPLIVHTDASGRYGFVDEKGKEVIPHTFRTAGNFTQVR